MRRQDLVIWLPGAALCLACESAQIPPGELSPAAPDWSAVVENQARPGNLVTNGGFEGDVLAPWFTAPGWEPAVVTTEQAREGRRSLAARFAPGEKAARRSVSFETGAVPLPRYASLWYRWEGSPPAEATLRVVLSVRVSSAGSVRELRYPLAVDHEGVPLVGRWLPFSADLHRDFSAEAGGLPAAIGALELTLEAEVTTGGRKPPPQGAVYFESVRLGYLPPPDTNEP